MDWLKNLLNSLPLESISEQLAQIILWWSKLVEGVPDTELPFLAYTGASLLVLLVLVLVVRLLPRPLGGILWLFVAAILLTPGDALASTDQIAPAIAGVAHGILMGDMTAATNAMLPILAVFTMLLIVGGIWQLLRGAIEIHILKNKKL